MILIVIYMMKLNLNSEAIYELYNNRISDKILS